MCGDEKIKNMSPNVRILQNLSICDQRMGHKSSASVVQDLRMAMPGELRSLDHYLYFAKYPCLAPIYLPSIYLLNMSAVCILFVRSS